MTELRFHTLLLYGFVALAVVSFIALFFVTAPYGRHAKGTKGPTINSTLGWVLMESPSALVFALCYMLGEHRASLSSVAFLLLWEAHYVHRAFIFPFRRRGGEREMGLSVAASAFFFTATNGYLNGRYLFTFAPAYLSSPEWVKDPRFIVGALLFVTGFAINQWADHVLFNLRRPGETGYKIPRGGLYELVSCPNYLGELIEWSGWALLTWSLPGLVFAIWTAANLVPRAIAHHRWYKGKFADYPPERRAVIPFVC